MHTYTTAGTFTVTLTATNTGGSNTVTKAGEIVVGSVSARPVASFISTVESGNAPLVVQFVDSSTNTPTSWVWSFGDGNTSAAQNPSHTYVIEGTYTVTLTATNSGGSDTETKNRVYHGNFHEAGCQLHRQRNQRNGASRGPV